MAGRPVVFDFIARDRNYTGPLRGMERHTTRFGTTLGKVSGVAVRAFGGVGVAAVGLGIAGATMGLKTAAGLEQAEIAFTKLLGSGKQAQGFLADLKRFAASTPFELPGLIDNARSLLGVGVAARNVIPILTSLGDASGALGLDQDRFNRVLLAVTQSMAKGRVQSEELMQITEAGIPVWQELAKATGKPVPELQKLVSQGKLAAEDTFPKLFDQLHKDYGGSMSKQAGTLSGLWSTFMDTINLGLADVIKPLEGELKTGLTGAIGLASGALKGISDFITKTVIPGLQTAKGWWDDNKTAVSDLGDTLSRLFTPSVKGATGAVSGKGGLIEGLGGLRGIFDRILWASLQTTLDFIQLARFVGNLELRILDLVVAAGYGVNVLSRLSGGSGHAADAMIAWARGMKTQTRVQLGKLADDAKTTQAQIDKLHGKDIPVTASLGLHFTKSFTQKDWLGVRVAAGRMAAGGLVRGPGGPTSDQVPALLSSGEFVVNARTVRQLGVDTLKRLNASRFAAGGPVGQVDTEAGAVNKLEAWWAGRTMRRGIPRLPLAGFVGGPAPKGAIQRYAMALLAARGWASQWPAFNALEMAEAGWNPWAVNPSSGAYGLAQILPAAWGHPVALGDWAGQLRWMVNYIAERWGSPANAWGGYHARGNWYGRGTDSIFTRPTMIGVGDRGPERVRVEPVGRGGGAMAPAYNVNVHVTINGGMYGSRRQFAADIAQEMRAAIREAQRRDGLAATPRAQLA